MAENRYNIYRSTVHWRYAMARPHLAFFDARLMFFIVLFAFHIRWWTFALLVLAIAGFTGAGYFNYALENVLRLARSRLVGPFRPTVACTRLRPMVEFGADALNVSAQSTSKSSVLNIFKTSIRPRWRP
ncbi:IcmT/TraK family protein [Roseovarius dicentrarchi]|uniref:IcmT/TraK family protein n=1 Tax=Roseovarius dicentrarchi TaxID=2250573 RepID=UPI000DEB75BA|nr:IcmT/TraK family protein [Roseovarius dicentrarchi]